METEYWLKRWREGRTGWQHTEVMPLLTKHWSALEVPRGSRVLVPLCGKSLDMLWLSQQGMHVFGVDISPVAIESFLAENHLHARARGGVDGTHYEITNAPDGGSIEIVNGDIFGVDGASTAACTAFYDRAATIALPAAMRERLARDVYAKLPAGSRGLLIALDYPEGEMQGPPFSVDKTEMSRLLDAQWDLVQLERRELPTDEPPFSEHGVTALHTSVYTLARRND